MAMPQNGPFEISGTVKYQGDLGRMSQWFADLTKPPAWAMGGQLVGNLQFKQAANLIQYEAAADVNNLVMADSSGGKFQEPLIRLSARGDYETKAGLIRLEKAQIASSFVAASAAGRYAQADNQSQADIAGQVSYDLDRLCGLYASVLGSEHHLCRCGASPVSWRGPLSLTSAQANAGLKWNTADIYGFQVGPGEIKPVLAGGVLQIEPAELTVSQGKLFLRRRSACRPSPWNSRCRRVT